MFNSPLPQISKDNVQVGTIGLIIELDIKRKNNSIVDISSATVKSIIIQKPDGTSSSSVAVFSTDGSDGKIKYTTSGSSEIDQAGDYKIQAYIKTASLETYTSTTGFTANANL